MSPGRILSAMGVAVLLLLHTRPCPGEDSNRWPQFRGPNGSGVAAGDHSYPDTLTSANQVWKVATPPGVSSPCVWEDRLFVTGHVPGTKTLITICLDRSTGATLWRQELAVDEVEKVHEVSCPANATPATDGQRVYVYFASFGLAAYDMAGNDVWRKPLPLRSTRFGSGTSPVVMGGRVILNRDHGGLNLFSKDGGSQILAVDAATGETAWQTSRGPSFVHYSSPVEWSGGGHPQVLLAGTGQLTAYDLATGEPAWWVDTLPPQVPATPVIAGDRVYLTGTGMFGDEETLVALPGYGDMLKNYDRDGDDRLTYEEIKDVVVVDRRASGGAGNSPVSLFGGRMDGDKSGEIDESEWTRFVDQGLSILKNMKPKVMAVKLGGAGDVSDSHVAWQDDKGATEVPSPLAYKDRLYLVRNGGIVHCRDLADGREVYKGRLGSAGGYYASPVAADGKIYFCSDAGVLTVIGAGDELVVLARNDLGDRIMATPAVAGGIVYVRTDHHLAAYGG